MSEKEVSLIKTIKTQIIIILTSFGFAGIGMTGLFMLSINGRVDSIERNIDRHETQIQTLIFKR